MRLDKRLIALVTLLFAVAQAGPAAAQKGLCAESELKEGALAFGRNLRLGRPAEFDDGVGIASGRCFPLYAGQERVAWASDVRTVGGRVLVRRCVEDASVGEVAPGARGGYVGTDYAELTQRAGGFAFRDLSLPLWGEFASPSFCGPLVAYWGTQPAPDGMIRVYAVLFDAGSMRVVGRRPLGATRIESDSRDFLPPPAWQASGAAATFVPAAGTRGLRRLTLRR